MDFYRAYFMQEGVGRMPMKETLKDFGIYLKDIPFDLLGEVKDVPSNSWFDEDGDDEYLPPGGVKKKAYEIDVEWAYKGTEANDKITAFINYLRFGDGVNSPFFTLQDNYTNLVRKGVRFVKLHNDAELVRQDGEDILIFKTTLKVNM